MPRFIIIPNDRRVSLKAMRFKDSRPTKVPQNCGWRLDPVPLKDGTGAAIPIEVLRHPRYAAIAAELKGFTVKNWTAEEVKSKLENQEDHSWPK